MLNNDGKLVRWLVGWLADGLALVNKRHDCIILCAADYLNRINAADYIKRSQNNLPRASLNVSLFFSIIVISILLLSLLQMGWVSIRCNTDKFIVLQSALIRSEMGCDVVVVVVVFFLAHFPIVSDKIKIKTSNTNGCIR